MDQNKDIVQSFNILSNALKKANLKGSFTLKESSDILQHLLLLAKFIEENKIKDADIKK